MNHEDIQALLHRLHNIPEGVEPWNAFSSDDDPALFRLLDLAADMPRLRSNETLAAWPAALWPELAATRDGLFLLQDLVDQPIVPDRAQASACYGISDLDAAQRELHDDHHAWVDFFFDPEQQSRLDDLLAKLDTASLPPWGELPRDGAPEIYALGEEALTHERFRQLTGFDIQRDEYTLTLSQQALDPAGIGWHRDLYWPKEWIGEDVFAVLYGLTSDAPENGGAYIYFVENKAELRYHYRQRHQATVIWNGQTREQRPIHAVSRYHGDATARHHLHFQCRRRS